MVNIRRQTAKKCRIKDLLNGRYVKREGWEPNYIETSFGRVSRSNVLGVIISKEGEDLVIDDGTGQIQLRSFDEKMILSKNNVGQVVLVIGKPRMYKEQKYIIPEIIKKIDDPKWIQYRMLELQNVKSNPVVQEEPIKEEKTTSIDIVDSLLKKISELDKGYGVKIDEVIKFFESATANRTISKLIEEGEIFEIKPGVVKVI